MFSSISESKDRYSSTQILQIALAFLCKCFWVVPKFQVDVFQTQLNIDRVGKRHE